MNEILTDYQKSVRRGELMITRYQVEHATYDQPADLIADILAYCLANNIDFESELSVARRHIRRERANHG